MTKESRAPLVRVEFARQQEKINTSANFGEVRQEFSDLSRNPHGKDKKLGAFYQAVYELSDPTEGDAHFSNFFARSLQITNERNFTPSLFANLFLRASQYADIYGRGRTEYDDSFENADAWKPLLVGREGLVTKEGEVTTHGTVVTDLLQSRETTTTIYQRYAGAKAALNALFPNQKLSVADFGCGANYGLRGLSSDIPFEHDIAVEDVRHSRTIGALLNTSVDITEGLGVDKNSVNGTSEFAWRLACSFYPGELTPRRMEELISLERKMAGVSGVKVIEGDLLELRHNHEDGTLPTAKLDAVILSTMLYQMEPEDQAKVIGSAEESLRDGGAIIVQDFAEVDQTDRTVLNFKPAAQWSEPFSYRILTRQKGESEWREFLQFNNGRCRVVRPGEDFDSYHAPMAA